MIKIAATLIAAFVASVACAEPTVPPEGKATSSQETEKTYAPYLAAVARAPAKWGWTPSTRCELTEDTLIPEGALLIVIKRVPCSVARGAYPGQEFYEVLYGGKPRLIAPKDVLLLSVEGKQGVDGAEFIDSRSEAEVAAGMEGWVELSTYFRARQWKDLRDRLAATSKSGITLIEDWIVYPEKYSSGTGFGFRVYNSSNKVIKYITASAVGLNPVNDPLSKTPAVLRGVGPIAPKAFGEYVATDMWTSKLFSTYRLSSMKLEFMDGTSKVITNIDAVRATRKDAQALRNIPEW